MVKTGLTMLSRVAGDIDFFYNPAQINKLATNTLPVAKMFTDLGQAVTYIPAAFHIEDVKVLGHKVIGKANYQSGSRKGKNKFLSSLSRGLPIAAQIEQIGRLASKYSLEEQR